MNEVKPIKVAVIGLGRAGWDIHIRRMRGHAEFKITAVADFEESRRNEARAEFGCDAYTDYKSLLKNADAEVVVVASHSSTHAPITIDALKTGRHVIVEKPMAANLKDAKRMAAAARAARKKLFVHQNYRFLSEVRHVMDIIRSGEPIGNVFEVRMRALYFARRNDWQTLKKFGGGLLNNHGAHFIDTALLLLESPVKDLWCDLKLITDAGDTEDHVKLLLRGRNGRVIDIEICTSCAFPESKWTLLGSHGTIVSDGKTSKVKRYDPKKAQPLKVIETPPENRRYGNDDKLPWEEYEIPAVGRETGDYYDNVVDVLRRGGKQIVTPQQVLDVMTVIERAKKGTKFA